jgi:hypothetical protein
MRIAIDLDDTLWKLVEDTDRKPGDLGAMCACGMPMKQIVDQTLVDLVHSLIPDHEVFLWSAGGIEYVKDWIKRFTPAWEGLVGVIPKEKGQNIDLCVDDQEVDLATVLLRVKRVHSDHWQE